MKILRQIVMALCVGLYAANLDAAEGSPKVLSEKGLAFKKDVKVEFGEGHGETRDEAIREALKDVLQKVVGVYVDSEFRMNNDEIIKDQIITHSNGFVEKYDVIEEGDSDDGRGKVVTIRARVKMRDFFSRMKKITPSQTVAVDGNLVATDIENQLNAERLLRNLLENLDLASLMEIRMAKSIRPEIQSATDDSVVIRYAFIVRYSNKKYYKEFLPRLDRVLTQIAKGKSKMRKQGMSTFGEVQNFCPFIADGLWGKEWEGHSVPIATYWPWRGSLQCREKEYRERASVIWRIGAKAEAAIWYKEWPLDDHLLSIFLQWREKMISQYNEMACELIVRDKGNNILSEAMTSLPFWYGSVGECVIPPFLVISYGRGVHRVLEYYGAIDITIKKEDVGKIKSIRFKLRSQNEGENE